ncbi:EboA domain-containing protein [Streptomyces sp. PSKA28]|uniref:EboA domain-containing protein n=1 Tax=Streptomyces himalayensis subsp. himalayensis TaxID=2756131 RepID=A0A7W0DKA7_9ACTN|nr:EboA domain-containing protein [Streptomyces himalayensis subsp. himalayensis]
MDQTQTQTQTQTQAQAQAQAQGQGQDQDKGQGHGEGQGQEQGHGTQSPLHSWELRFAEAGRRCGPEYADAARLLLLHAAGADPATLTGIYAQGNAAERRAVLHALPHLVPGPQALQLVEDALRTNDTRLVAAAVGPYAAEHLDPHNWRHAVLKCLFTGVSVDAVAGLAERARADAELARMLVDYANERTAAGRPIPEDLHRVLALTTLLALPTAPSASSAIPSPPSAPSTGEES